MTHGTYTPYLFFGRYFLWDAIVSLVHYEGIDFVVHGTRRRRPAPAIRPMLTYELCMWVKGGSAWSSISMAL